MRFRFAGLLILVFVVAAFAQMKVGYINSEEIFNKYKGTQDAQKKFDKIAAEVQQDITNREKEIKEMEAQLEKQSLLLSKERKKELEDKIKTKTLEYRELVAKNYGQEGELVKRNAQMTQPIIAEIDKIIEKIAKDEEYDFIYDARAGGIVYAKVKYDLTDRVIKILNKE